MGRPTKTTPQEMVVAHALFGGDSAVSACRKARYAPSTIKARAAKIARSKKVQDALQQIARSIAPGELTELGRGRLKQKLCSGERNNVEMLKYIRTAAELEGQLGGPQELHLHQHSTLPVRVQQMLEQKMAELLAARESAAVIDAETVTPAEITLELSAGTSAPEPIQQEEPRLTPQERQNNWLRF